jgi:hypothetical protein
VIPEDDLKALVGDVEVSDESRVLMILAHGPTTVAEIVGYTGLSHVQVGRALQRIAREEGVLRYRRYETGTQYRLDRHPRLFED